MDGFAFLKWFRSQRAKATTPVNGDDCIGYARGYEASEEARGAELYYEADQLTIGVAAEVTRRLTFPTPNHQLK